MNFSAVILAGGKSSRMGRDKAWLELGGQTLLARQVILARSCGAAEVLIAGRADVDYSALGCPVLTDRFREAGPLAGIERALAAMAAPLLLVLAVDMPALEFSLLEKIRGAGSASCGVIPRLNGRVEPLVAYYPRAALGVAEEMLRGARVGAASSPGPTDFARRCIQQDLARYYEVSPAEAGCFQNLNAPQDLRP